MKNESAMNNIPKGYKQTGVGVIPEDWEVKSLGDCFTFSGGYTASRDQLSNDGYCYLHYGDIHGANKTFIDVKKEYSEIPKLNVTIRNVSPKSLLNEGDVVFVDASEDDEGASKHIVVFNSEGIPFISGLHTIVSKSKNDIIDNGYKRYCFQPYYVKSQFKFYAVGTKVTGISKTNIAKILIPLPPTKAEQTAIAAALSDTDALIIGLEKLIAKKRNIKQGTMQQLLKPKDIWAMKKLGDILTFSGGYSASREQLSNEGFCYLHYGDIHGAKKTFINVKNEYTEIPKLKISLKNVSPKSLLNDGDIVFVDASEDDEGTSRHLIVKNPNGIPYISGLHTIVAKSTDDLLDNDFKRYCFQTKVVKSQFKFYAVGTKVSGISKTNIAKIEIAIPPKSEQPAIAQILSDMDAEIEALERKLNKYRQIKQGMMQELLTGKTRLV